MPTVCDYAGIPRPQQSRGESLKNTLEGKADQAAFETAIMEFKHIARIVRHRDFKYVKYYEYSGQQDEPFVSKKDGKAEKFTPGTGRDKYKDTGKRLLFNIKEDPWEINDLSKDPEYVSKLEEMDDVLVEKFESIIEPGTHFDRN
jgi:arylsulfatase A-like enzyme